MAGHHLALGGVREGWRVRPGEATRQEAAQDSCDKAGIKDVCQFSKTVCLYGMDCKKICDFFFFNV